jgi:S1-C subfamily serine protease
MWNRPKTYDAVLVGGERRRDVAVLKIDAPLEDLVAVELPPKDTPLMVGQKALAIGNPFGLDHTLTVGVISALDREVQGYGGVTIPGMIQTDASINPGNSGGPLLDSKGRLIGMNTQIFSSSGASAGIGFAVPSSIIRRVVPQIIEHGKVVQAGMGVTIVPDAFARRLGVEGVILDEVRAGTPASTAGMVGMRYSPSGQPTDIGDVVVDIGGTPIVDYDDLYNAFDRYRPGDEVSVTLERAGRRRVVQVTLMPL